MTNNPKQKTAGTVSLQPRRLLQPYRLMVIVTVAVLVPPRLSVIV